MIIWWLSDYLMMGKCQKQIFSGHFSMSLWREPPRNGDSFRPGQPSLRKALDEHSRQRQGASISQLNFRHEWHEVETEGMKFEAKIGFNQPPGPLAFGFSLSAREEDISVCSKSKLDGSWFKIPMGQVAYVQAAAVNVLQALSGQLVITLEPGEPVEPVLGYAAFSKRDPNFPFFWLKPCETMWRSHFQNQFSVFPFDKGHVFISHLNPSQPLLPLVLAQHPMATELHGTWPEALHRLGQLQWRRLRSHGAVYGVYGAALRALRMGRGLATGKDVAGGPMWWW